MWFDVLKIKTSAGVDLVVSDVDMFINELRRKLSQSVAEIYEGPKGGGRRSYVRFNPPNGRVVGKTRTYNVTYRNKYAPGKRQSFDIIMNENEEGDYYFRSVIGTNIKLLPESQVNNEEDLLTAIVSSVLKEIIISMPQSFNLDEVWNEVEDFDTWKKEVEDANFGYTYDRQTGKMVKQNLNEMIQSSQENNLNLYDYLLASEMGLGASDIATTSTETRVERPSFQRILARRGRQKMPEVDANSIMNESQKNELINLLQDKVTVNGNNPNWGKFIVENTIQQSSNKLGEFFKEMNEWISSIETKGGVPAFPNPEELRNVYNIFRQSINYKGD